MTPLKGHSRTGASPHSALRSPTFTGSRGALGVLYGALGLRGLLFRALGLRGLLFRALGLRGLLFRALGLRGLLFRALGLRGLLFFFVLPVFPSYFTPGGSAGLRLKAKFGASGAPRKKSGKEPGVSI